ncbi:MAG TPA: peptidoglycan recognition family protein [Streptosporangiaceae bacterium]|jgi:hypothetical protein
MENNRWPVELERRHVLSGTAALAGAVILGGAADLAVPGIAEAAVKRPYIYTRGQWGARKPKVAATVLNRKPDHIVIHHTASPNSKDYSTHHGAALSRSIQAFHMDHNGWDDMGEQFTISRGGYVMEGRNRTLSAVAAHKHVVGAQTANENSHTLGIENEGTYITATPTAKLWNALIETCAWLCDHYGLNPYTAIVGHRDYNSTQCPGNKLYSMLPTLRKSAAKRMAAAGTKVRLTERAAPKRTELRGAPQYPRFRYDDGPALGPDDPTR